MTGRVLGALLALWPVSCGGHVEHGDAGTQDRSGPGGAADGGLSDATSAGGAAASAGGRPGFGGADAGLCAAFQRIQDYNGYVDAGTVVSILGPARAATCETRLSDYDVTCTADTDCVNVPLGNACVTPCDLLCDVAAINRRDLAKLEADNAATPIGFEHGVCGTFCGCPLAFDPRCVSGRCTQPFSQSDGG